MTQATDTDIRELKDLILGLDRKIDDIKSDIRVIDTRLIEVEKKIEKLDTRIDRLDNRLWVFLSALLTITIGTLSTLGIRYIIVNKLF